jgi:hypothetical protein
VEFTLLFLYNPRLFPDLFIHGSISVGMRRITKEMLAAIYASRYDLEPEFIEVKLVPDGRLNPSPCRNRMSFI